jgi:hypothetical protein
MYNQEDNIILTGLFTSPVDVLVAGELALSISVVSGVLDVPLFTETFAFVSMELTDAAEGVDGATSAC